MSEYTVTDIEHGFNWGWGRDPHTKEPYPLRVTRLELMGEYDQGERWVLIETYSHQLYVQCSPDGRAIKVHLDGDGLAPATEGLSASGDAPKRRRIPLTMALMRDFLDALPKMDPDGPLCDGLVDRCLLPEGHEGQHFDPRLGYVPVAE